MPDAWGTYRGVITHNADPARRGRVRVRVPQVLGAAISTWADPLTYYPGVPPVGGAVWVSFAGGDTSSPIWSSPHVPQGSADWIAPQSSASTGTPGWATATAWTEFTGSEWTPITIQIPPTRYLMVFLAIEGYNGNVGSGGTVADGTLWLGTTLKWSDGTVIRGPATTDSAKIVGAAQSGTRRTSMRGSGFAYYSIPQPPATANPATVTIVPTWYVNSNADKSVIVLSNARMWVVPMLYGYEAP